MDTDASFAISSTLDLLHIKTAFRQWHAAFMVQNLEEERLATAQVRSSVDWQISLSCAVAGLVNIPPIGRLLYPMKTSLRQVGVIGWVSERDVWDPGGPGRLDSVPNRDE